MFRKFALFATLLLLCVSCAFAEEAEVTGMMMEEPELDITELIEIAEEEKAREKKDSDGAYIMTVTCTGDFTIGGDTYHHKDLFTPELERHGGDINFVMENVRSLFMDDDLTLLNFEGTLTDTKSVPSSKRNNEFLFSITPSAVSVLPDNGVEAVSLDNNHVRDHGEEGLADTKAALDSAGVLYSTPLDLAVFNYKDQIQVAMLSYNCIDRYGTSFKKHQEEYSASFLAHDTFEEAVCDEIAQAKALYPLVIVSFHWGKEPTSSNPQQGYIPTDNQIRLGRMAVDAGADLVVGTHSHRIQPIECYNNKYILYSLGNFCFAGNSKPRDMSSIIFQIRYRVKNGEVSFRDFRVIPIRISSVKERNDLVPWIFPDGYDRDSVLLTLKGNTENDSRLSWGVTDYPLEFQ